MEIIEIDPPAVSKELKKRWYDTDPLTCPKCRGETAIISFIDQPEVIKKTLQHLDLWEEAQAPPDRSPPEITLDLSYSQLI